MADEPTSTADIEFWEFVSCAKCHLPYASEAGRSVPFWLTECGHVICNHHLNPDQSCTSCGSTGIALMSLQRELEAPMSDWFKSIPSALDVVAFAAKFQQEVMARQVRFYRSRHQQIRIVMEKLRAENNDLKRTNEMLTQENDHLKHRLGYQDLGIEGGNDIQTNQNGKRPMFFAPSSQYESPSNRPRTGSSPLQTSTSARLTIPIGQRNPESSHRLQKDPHSIQTQTQERSQTNGRPMSHQIKKFAYIPPETPRTSTALSRDQMAPKLVRTSQINQVDPGFQAIQHRSRTPQSTRGQPDRAGGMGPPPVPQERLTTIGAHAPHFSGRRFIPAQSVQRPLSSTSNGPQRFFAKTGINNHNQSGTTGSWENSQGSNPGESSRFVNC